MVVAKEAGLAGRLRRWRVLDRALELQVGAGGNWHVNVLRWNVRRLKPLRQEGRCWEPDLDHDEQIGGYGYHVVLVADEPVGAQVRYEGRKHLVGCGG